MFNRANPKMSHNEPDSAEHPEQSPLLIPSNLILSNTRLVYLQPKEINLLVGLHQLIQTQ